MHPAHKRAVRKGCVFSIFFLWLQATQISPHIVFRRKDSANRTQNKMNLFIFMLRCSLSSPFGGKDKKEILYLRYR